MDELVLNIKCRICGKSFQVKVKSEDYNDWVNKRKAAQNAFPYLSPADRELLISQTCNDCWEQLWKEEE